MSDLEDFLRDHHNPIVAQLNKEIADLRAENERLKESTSVVLIERMRNQYAEVVAERDELKEMFEAALADSADFANQADEMRNLRAELAEHERQWKLEFEIVDKLTRKRTT